MTDDYEMSDFSTYKILMVYINVRRMHNKGTSFGRNVTVSAVKLKVDTSSLKSR